MNLECSCGKRFRSYGAEARHRHNFPAYCRRPKLSPAQDKLYGMFCDNPNKQYERSKIKASFATIRVLLKHNKIELVEEHNLQSLFDGKNKTTYYRLVK